MNNKKCSIKVNLTRIVILFDVISAQLRDGDFVNGKCLEYVDTNAHFRYN
jgi:hypothetical protein